MFSMLWTLWTTIRRCERHGVARRGEQYVSEYVCKLVRK